LESSFHGVLDLIEILDGGSFVEKNIGAGGVGTEAPDLECVILIPFVLLSQEFNSLLNILL
jgi:hypothetical protein